jgi:hypothetical protein
MARREYPVGSGLSAGGKSMESSSPIFSNFAQLRPARASASFLPLLLIAGKFIATHQTAHHHSLLEKGRNAVKPDRLRNALPMPLQGDGPSALVCRTWVPRHGGTGSRGSPARRAAAAPKLPLPLVSAPTPNLDREARGKWSTPA